MTDTIFAVSSGSPPAGIAVLRISGPNAFAAAAAIAGTLPPPRRAALRRVRDPATGETIDRAVVLLFAGPASATGEDIAELHLHGSRAVVRAVERVLATLPGCRAAEAGEFTRRALEAGRIDLTEAEGLADLLAAETEGAASRGRAQRGRGLRRRIEDWTTRAVLLSAKVEAVIDHGDEADAADEVAILATVRHGAVELARDIGVLLAQPPVERLHDGVRVVLAGPPNSGKSTLFNALIGRDAAIVSPIAGTTRDRIEAPVVRNGVAWLFIDTAGIAEATDDPIEAIGIARTHESVAGADIVLWLGDDLPDTIDDTVILVHPRADMLGRAATPAGRVATDSHSATGMVAIWHALTGRAAALLPGADVPALNARQRDLCWKAQNALSTIALIRDPLIIGEDFRYVLLLFDKLVGRADVEAVLDALFGQFCIGK